MKKFLVLFLVIPTLCFSQISNWVGKTVEELSAITSGVTNIASKAYWEEHAYLQLYDIITAYGVAHILDASDGTPDSVIVVDASGNVTMGYYSTLTSLRMKNDSLYVEDATANRPILILKNTNVDANSSRLHFIKDSVSPADNDLLGSILFYGDDNSGTSRSYGQIVFSSKEVDSLDYSGQISFSVTVDAVSKSFMKVYGKSDGTPAHAILILNDDSIDMDFRVESDNSANALYMDGATGKVSVLNASADSALTVTGGGHFSGGLKVDGTISGTLSAASAHQLAASDADPDSVVVVDADGDVTIGSYHSLESVKITGDSLYITDLGANKPVFILRNTNTDANSPLMIFQKFSASPADSDAISTKWYQGYDSNAGVHTYASETFYVEETRDGDEAGGYILGLAFNGSLLPLPFITATGDSGFDTGKIIFNDSSYDIDFRVESDNSENALFVQGSDGKISVLNAAPDSALTVTGGGHFTGGLVIDGALHADSTLMASAVAYKPELTLRNTNADANSAILNFQKFSTGSAADADIIATKYYWGYDDADANYIYAMEHFFMNEVTDGDEAGGYTLSLALNGSVLPLPFISAISHDAGANTGEVMINDDSYDIDFRVESDGDTAALFVDASTNRVGVLNAAPAKSLHVMGDVAIGDTATAVTDRYLYFGTDGATTTEYLKWSGTTGIFYLSDSLTADGYIDYCDVYNGNALEQIMQIKGVDGTERGAYADLDHHTLPDGVMVDADGRPARDLSKIVSVMIKAIQELKEENEKLKKNVIFVPIIL